MNNTYIIAVSGGVDSVVLLHMLAAQADRKLVVAHFDHGIRSDSADDAEFVRSLAEAYGFEYEIRREELGAKASEEVARNRRYAFLRDVAKKHNAAIVTAHHADDVIETIAINFIRGTGWRGLAVLDSDIERPLIDMSKQDIHAYAEQHNIVWHEDSTNASNAYLRNRLRLKAQELSDDTKRQVRGLRAHQISTKRAIDAEVAHLVGNGPMYSRHLFIHVTERAAMEMLRMISRAKLTRPQLMRLLMAIKTAKAGTTYEAGAGVEFVFTSRNFSVQLIK